MIEFIDSGNEKVIIAKASKKLTHEDYMQLEPKIEAEIAKYGKLHFVFWLHDFEGWEARAMWDDIKFDTKHCKEFERCAIVGDKKWEEWMIKLAKPFMFYTTMKYFDASQYDEAIAWAKEGL